MRSRDRAIGLNQPAARRPGAGGPTLAIVRAVRRLDDSRGQDTGGSVAALRHGVTPPATSPPHFPGSPFRFADRVRTAERRFFAGAVTVFSASFGAS